MPARRAVQDFAVAYNGPSGSAQFVADVVGYMVENQATASVLGPSLRGHLTETATLAAVACTTGFASRATAVPASRQLALKAQFALGTFPQAHWVHVARGGARRRLRIVDLLPRARR